MAERGGKTTSINKKLSRRLIEVRESRKWKLKVYEKAYEFLMIGVFDEFINRNEDLSLRKFIALMAPIFPHLGFFLRLHET